MDFVRNNLLGSIYGKENLHTEFKEYCLKLTPSNYLDEKEIENIIKTGNWNVKMDSVINDNIIHYMDTVFPKYLSSFSNSKIDGKFILGISDRGEIMGIPSNCEINKNKLYDILKNIIKDNIKTKEHFDNIFNNISIDIIELDTNSILLEDEAIDYYNDYIRKIIIYNNKLNEYHKKKLEWLLKLNNYTGKLTNIINTTEYRKEFIEYINIEKPNYFIDYPEILEKLEKNKYISIPNGNIIRKCKTDDTSIFYWLIKYKDCNVKRISNEKPKKPLIPYMLDIPNILSKISSMRYKFLLNNIKYYLIEININGSKIKNKIYIKNNNNRWILKTRVLDKFGSPSSTLVNNI